MKFVESFIADTLKHEKVHSTLNQLLEKLLEVLAPVFLGIGIVWGVMLLGIGAILVILLRKGGGGVGV